MQFYARVYNPAAPSGFVDNKLGASNPVDVIPDTGCGDIQLPQTLANKYNGYPNNSQPPSSFVGPVGASAQVAVPAQNVALVVGFADLNIKPALTKLAIPIDKLVNAGGFSKVVGVAPGLGPAPPTLMGIPFFLAVQQVIFDSGISTGGQQLSNPSISVVPA